MNGIEFGRLILGLRDFIVAPLLLFLLYRIGVRFIARIEVFNNKEDISLFKKTFFLKVFCAIVSALIFQFYYKYGDTFGYYDGGEMVTDAMYADLSIGWEIFTSNPEDYSNEALKYIGYFQKAAKGTFFIIKLSGFLMFFFFKSYMAVSFLISFFALLGTWRIYEFFIYHYPEIKNKLKYSILFVPTAMFWGTGLLKDPICIFCMGYLIIYLQKILIKKQIKLSHFLIVCVSSYVLFRVKSYIFVATLGGFFVYYLLFLLSRPLSKLYKTTLLICILFISFFGVNFLVNSVKEQFDFINNKDDAILYFDTVQNAQEFATNEAGGSGYVLPDFELSTFGIIKSIALSVNVACFRPYPWETKKPIIFLDMIQSLIAMIGILYALFKIKFHSKFFKLIFSPIKFYKTLIANPVIVMSIFIIFIIGFLTGFISFNFGTLSRFRIPLLPFLLSLPYLILYNHDKKNLKKQNEL